MVRPAELALTFAAGSLIGGLFVGVIMPSDVKVEAPQTSKRGERETRDQECETKVRALVLENQSLKDRASKERDRLRVFMEAIRLSVSGNPIGWENAPDSYQEETVLEAILDVEDHVLGCRLMDIDCSEYPCIAALRVDDGVTFLETARSIRGHPNLEGLTRVSQKVETSDGQLVLIQVLGPPGDSDYARRIEARVQAVKDSVADGGPSK